MRAAFLSLLVLAAAPVPCAAANPAASTPAYTLAQSAVLSVPAGSGESYRVYVAWPAGPPPERGWPVLYILDGEDVFAPTAITARRLARYGGRTGIQPGVVVAIDAGPLARRTRDYTPEAGPDAIPAGAPAHGHATGGADAFLDLVQTRIKPAIERQWRIDTSRETLAGHSFGGLLTLYALTDHPALFDRYAAISPSFWYGDGLLLRRPFAAPKGERRAVVHISAGDAEGAQVGDGSPIATFSHHAEAAGNMVSMRILPGFDHGATMLAAIPEIVKIAFGDKPQSGAPAVAKAPAAARPADGTPPPQR